MAPAAPYRPDPAFAALSEAPFADKVAPAEFPEAVLRYRNDAWAARVGLAHFDDDDWKAHFARFHPLPDNLGAPLALRYHGHQFRSYNPDIGDGRGFLFAQLRDDQGRLLDLATKGSGKTPYSRTADGRLTLKGGVREILATEMLEALGVYTSKTFSVIETGESLHRNDEPSPTRACVLVRLGHSHVRFGVFQRLKFEGNDAAIARLVDYCIDAFEPDLAALQGPARIAAFYARVVSRTARLVGDWMAAGFVHGVLNTDNMNVTGESFDYGPWRFLPTADFSFTAAYFDQTGLYAYGRQPEAALWNLSRLGGCLTGLAGEAALNEALETFGPAFERGMARAFFRRLGVLQSGDVGADYAFVIELLQWMQARPIPFERVFFDWFGGPASEARAATSPYAGDYAEASFAPIRERLLGSRADRPERLGDSYFARAEPVTMLIEEVERIWSAIAERDDWGLLTAKLDEIASLRRALDLDASAFASPLGD